MSIVFVSDYVVILIIYKWAMITLFNGISKFPTCPSLEQFDTVKAHKRSSLYDDC